MWWSCYRCHEISQCKKLRKLGLSHAENITHIGIVYILGQYLSSYSDKSTYIGRIGSTKLELPKWHKYGTFNRVIRVSNQRLDSNPKMYSILERMSRLAKNFLEKLTDFSHFPVIEARALCFCVDFILWNSNAIFVYKFVL